MSIPDFQTLMLPVLKHVSDNKEHTLKELVEFSETAFKLTEDEKKETVASGQRVIYNRTAWAVSYMSSALLVEIIKRGCYKITNRGIELLKSNPEKINIKLLKENYPEFSESRKPKNKEKNIADIKDDESISSKSPDELIDDSYYLIIQKLSDELLSLILKNSPSYFEKLVIDLLVGMGYGGTRKEAGQAVGKSGDEGIDGVISEDRLGLDNIYIQAKRWAVNRTVGRPEIQGFVGALAGKQASKGIFITTSGFTSEARNYVKNLQQKVILIDGKELTQLMIEYNIGVSTYSTYIIKKIDSDYFDEV